MIIYINQNKKILNKLATKGIKPLLGMMWVENNIIRRPKLREIILQYFKEL